MKSDSVYFDLRALSLEMRTDAHLSFHLLAGLNIDGTRLTQGTSRLKCFPSCCENALTLVRRYKESKEYDPEVPCI